MKTLECTRVGCGEVDRVHEGTQVCHNHRGVDTMLVCSSLRQSYNDTDSPLEQDDGEAETEEAEVAEAFVRLWVVPQGYVECVLAVEKWALVRR